MVPIRPPKRSANHQETVLAHHDFTYFSTDTSFPADLHLFFQVHAAGDNPQPDAVDPPPEHDDLWLDVQIEGKNRQELLRPFPSEKIEAYQPARRSRGLVQCSAVNLNTSQIVGRKLGPDPLRPLFQAGCYVTTPCTNQFAQASSVAEGESKKLAESVQFDTPGSRWWEYGVPPLAGRRRVLFGWSFEGSIKTPSPFG